MNGTNNSGGGMNLSGGRGSPYEMEPWAYEARGRNRGLEQGRREGHEEGYSDGRSKGRSEGYTSGRSEGFDAGLLGGIEIGRSQAWDEANDIINKLNSEFSAERDDYNRSAVVINALRMTVESLIRENPKAASHIRKVFIDNYKKEVDESIHDGWIKISPHTDKAFIESSPKMYEFIIRAF